MRIRQLHLHTLQPVGDIQSTSPITRTLPALSTSANASSQSYEVLTDAYHNIQRLNLFEFDGSPMNPMYLVYSPPEMLPTSTLNPTTSATAGATSTSSSKKRNMKRDGREVPLNFKMQKKGMDTMNPDRWWWIGLTLTGVGGLLYFGPRRMGLSI